MTRLAIVVEGQTEEDFVRKTLAAHLQLSGVWATPFLVGRARHGRGGGDVTTERLVTEMRFLRHSHDAVTSLVDFYGFRGKKDLSPDDLLQVIRDRLEASDERFVFPYVQVHEFEGLLFSNVDAFDGLVPRAPIERLRAIRLGFDTPEDINDGTETAPSKRLQRLIPKYRKRLDGPDVAREIGLNAIRRECPRFDSWMSRMEALGEDTSS